MRPKSPKPIKRPAARARPERARPAPAPAKPAAQPLYLFLTEPGLGDLALLELKHLKITARKSRPTRLHSRNHDLLVLPGHLVEAGRARSRLCTNVLRAPIFGRAAITPRQLDLLAALCRAGGYKRMVSTVTGEAFGRQDLMRWVKRELGERGVTLGEAGRALWLVVVDQAFYFAEEIQNYHDAPGRGAAPVREGALPATIAAAMAFAAELGADEVVWDPVAGSGNLLGEVAALGRGGTLMATDVDPAAAEALAQRFGPRAWTACADAAEVALPTETLTLTIANLPFGRQYKADSGLYAGVMANSLAHAAPRWRGVFLTSDHRAISQAARASGLALKSVAEIKVRGLDATIWKTERPEGV
jgi:Putative RNA methylase family UPF0020